MKKVAVVLSGSGVYDGSEIHEAVVTLLALDRGGAHVQCLAPDIPQMHVINHLAQAPGTGSRNVLEESARLARGNIKNLAKADVNDYDAIIFPGGFGAAKNLCDFAVKGADCTVNPDVETFILKGLKAGKVFGFMCIAPAIAAKVAGKEGLKPRLTIGTDAGTSAALEQMGGLHVNAGVTEIVVDEKNKIASTPAYMLGQSISEVAEGIEKLVVKILEMC